MIIKQEQLENLMRMNYGVVEFLKSIMISTSTNLILKPVQSW